MKAPRRLLVTSPPLRHWEKTTSKSSLPYQCFGVRMLERIQAAPLVSSIKLQSCQCSAAYKVIPCSSWPHLCITTAGDAGFCHGLRHTLNGSESHKPTLTQRSFLTCPQARIRHNTLSTSSTQLPSSASVTSTVPADKSSTASSENKGQKYQPRNVLRSLQQNSNPTMPSTRKHFDSSLAFPLLPQGSMGSDEPSLAALNITAVL